MEAKAINVRRHQIKSEKGQTLKGNKGGLERFGFKDSTHVAAHKLPVILF